MTSKGSCATHKEATDSGADSGENKSDGKPKSYNRYIGGLRTNGQYSSNEPTEDEQKLIWAMWCFAGKNSSSETRIRLLESSGHLNPENRCEEVRGRLMNNYKKAKKDEKEEAKVLDDMQETLNKMCIEPKIIGEIVCYAMRGIKSLISKGCSVQKLLRIATFNLHSC